MCEHSLPVQPWSGGCILDPGFPQTFGPGASLPISQDAGLLRLCGAYLGGVPFSL